MNPETLSSLIYDTVNSLISEGHAGNLTAADLPDISKFVPVKSRDRSHGDWASNAAMQLAKKAGMSPRDFAQAIAKKLEDDPGISSVEIAGPGFINITLSADSAAQTIADVEKLGDSYGDNGHLGGATYNVEFVSANPTGPIHIGGTRWAALGDSMSRVLQANGAKVVREYYFNDHGAQIDKFAKTLVAAAHGEPTPPDGYKGQYVDDIAKRVVEQANADGVDILNLPRVETPEGEGDSAQREEFRKRGVEMMFAEIQKSMEDFRVPFDVYFHENSLYESGAVDKAIEMLRGMGNIYEKDGATWLTSTKYGDDKDRVIIKSNGEATYFASDLAYYIDKRHRAIDPADVTIYLLGADHSGYVGRMMALCAAFGDKPGYNMQIPIGQMVNVLNNGEAVRMSKRAGNVIIIDDLVDVVGVDAARYALVRTSYNQQLDIDLAALSEHTNENPVYYVQYAHARSKNVDRNAAAAGITHEGADLSLLDTQADSELIAQLALFPGIVTVAADLLEPHRVAHYLEDLAGAYHKWYANERVVPMALTEAEKRLPDDRREALEISKNPSPARAAARLRLNDATGQVIRNGLALLAVSAPDKM
jgi:arginyl-tRNA synthetase